MIKVLRLVWVCAVLVVLASAAQCADIYPTVGFAFNSATFEYSWTVYYTTDVTVNLSRFQVYASLPAASWTNASGPWSGSPAQDEAWSFTAPPNGDGTYALRWLAPTQKVRTPAGGAWTGVFKVTVPNSQPIQGSVLTYASATKSLVQPSSVPYVPEPSSIVSLLSLVGLAPLVFRKKRR